MGLLSRFEGKMEDTVEGAAEKMGGSSLSPVQIAKRAEKQMRREKMVGAGKQYAPTLYTILVSPDDDARLFGYYPTLAGETETYLSAKAVEHGLVMDGQPLVRFIADEGLKRGKFEVIAEMVAGPLVKQLRREEMERYGLATPSNRFGGAAKGAVRPGGGAGAGAVKPAGASPAFVNLNPSTSYDEYDEFDEYDDYEDADPGATRAMGAHSGGGAQATLIDITNNASFALTGMPMQIGRESVRDIVVPDINASRTHAEIRRDPSGSWVIADLGSTNGTFLNGRQIKSAPLSHGDTITIGTTDLTFNLH